MDINKIKALLEKYLDGNCSLSEEQTLQQFFKEAEVSAELQDWQVYFNSIATIKQAPISENFDDLVLDEIDKSVVPAASKKRKTIFKIPNWKADFQLVAAAAIIGALLFFMQLVNEITKPPVTNNVALTEQELKEAKKAYVEALQIMQFVSEKFNKGKEPLLKIKRVNKINNKIKRKKNEIL